MAFPAVLSEFAETSLKMLADCASRQTKTKQPDSTFAPVSLLGTKNGNSLPHQKHTTQIRKTSLPLKPTKYKYKYKYSTTKMEKPLLITEISSETHHTNEAHKSPFEVPVKSFLLVTIGGCHCCFSEECFHFPLKAGNIQSHRTRTQDDNFE